MTTTLDVNPAVADFASAVRRSLSDLGADVLDDLTDGLEADLADKLADGAELGDPAAYAAELRAAAGLEAPRRIGSFQRARHDVAEIREGIRSMTQLPAFSGVVSFLVALRPLWWVARGWALFFILGGLTVVPQNMWDYPVLAALLLMSVQWGRGRWLPWRWSRGGVIALSIIAVIALPFAMSSAVSRLSGNDYAEAYEYIPEGMFLNGEQVTNIFAYGADGKPLTDVQLFDQEGQPLDLYGDSSYVWDYRDGEKILVPSDDVSARSGWNVYPLESVRDSAISDDGFTLERDARRSPVPPPFDSVQQLLGYEVPVEEDFEPPVGESAE